MRNFIYPLGSLLSVRKLRSLLSFGVKGYLAEIGWMEAYRARVPIGMDGKPLPWFTYSFIDFMEERLKPSFHVFEYGSGYSTRYFAEKTGTVTAVEHDQDWLDTGKKDKAENVSLIFREGDIDGQYCRTPLQLETKFDIVVIDGYDRCNCCKQAPDVLTPDGVVIFDDTELEKFQEGVAYLKARGFKMLSFSGISPGLFYRKTTSIFYRPLNCFDI